LAQFNSAKFLSLALRSLKSLFELGYDNYEVIVVDNGFTDGSFERVREFLEKKGSLRRKIIELNYNLGFTGGNNIGFIARDRGSRYMLLLN
jgi:GT2 family glycosyltransferase